MLGVKPSGTEESVENSLSERRAPGFDLRSGERVLGMRRETFGPSRRTALCFGDQKINLRPVGALADDPDWFTGSVEAAGSEDLCFVTRASPDDVGAHLAACGVEVISGPVIKVGALGQMTSHYCRDIDGNLVEIAVY